MCINKKDDEKVLFNIASLHEFGNFLHGSG